MNDPVYEAQAFEIAKMAENIKTLEAENTKLLECLKDFADAIKNDDGFGIDQGWMLNRMRDLGIR